MQDFHHYIARPSYRYDTALCKLVQPVSRFVLAEKPIQRRIYATGVFINQTIHHAHDLRYAVKAVHILLLHRRNQRTVLSEDDAEFTCGDEARNRPENIYAIGT